MPCEKHGPRASVTTKTSAFGLGFCLLSSSGYVFHMAWETMIKSYIIPFAHWLDPNALRTYDDDCIIYSNFGEMHFIYSTQMELVV